MIISIFKIVYLVSFNRILFLLSKFNVNEDPHHSHIDVLLLPKKSPDLAMCACHFKFKAFVGMCLTDLLPHRHDTIYQ